MECLLCTRHFRRKLHASLGILIWMVGWGTVRAGLWDKTDWAASCRIRSLWTEEEKTTGVGGKGHCSQQGRNSRESWHEIMVTLVFEHVSQRSFGFCSVTACAHVCVSVCVCVCETSGPSFVWILFCDSLCTCVCQPVHVCVTACARVFVRQPVHVCVCDSLCTCVAGIRTKMKR